MKITIEQLSESDLATRGVFAWPIWTKDASCFDWTYDRQEQCYFLEGKGTVETASETVTFRAGDFVTFPKGLSCTWTVLEPVRKHYAFS